MSQDRPHPLPLARRRLSEAVTALAEPVAVWESGVCRWTPPVYTRLRAALRAKPSQSGRRVPSSRLPCRTDVLGLIFEIDTTAAKWEPHEKSTLDRLRQLAARDRAPEDVPALNDYRMQVESWTLRATDLLCDRSPEVALRLPCPSCGRKHVYRTTNGETVRSWALRVSEAGARCQNCQASWKPEQFEFLAALLGCLALR